MFSKSMPERETQQSDASFKAERMSRNNIVNYVIFYINSKHDAGDNKAFKRGFTEEFSTNEG